MPPPPMRSPSQAGMCESAPPVANLAFRKRTTYAVAAAANRVAVAGWNVRMREASLASTLDLGQRDLRSAATAANVAAVAAINNADANKAASPRATDHQTTLISFRGDAPSLKLRPGMCCRRESTAADEQTGELAGSWLRECGKLVWLPRWTWARGLQPPPPMSPPSLPSTMPLPSRQPAQDGTAWRRERQKATDRGRRNVRSKREHTVRTASRLIRLRLARTMQRPMPTLECRSGTNEMQVPPNLS